MELTSMKTLKIDDDTHSKLTSLLGELTAQTSKMQTYQDAINSLLEESVMLPPELIEQTRNFVEENKQLGFTTKEEFVRDAIRFRLTWLKGDNQCLEIPREQYDRLSQAIREMDTPFSNADDFISRQIEGFVEKYEEHKKTR